MAVFSRTTETAKSVPVLVLIQYERELGARGYDEIDCRDAC